MQSIDQLDISVDYTPALAPKIFADRMEIYLAGFFFNNKKKETRPPFPLPVLPTGLLILLILRYWNLRLLSYCT